MNFRSRGEDINRTLWTLWMAVRGASLDLVFTRRKGKRIMLVGCFTEPILLSPPSLLLPVPVCHSSLNCSVPENPSSRHFQWIACLWSRRSYLMALRHSFLLWVPCKCPHQLRPLFVVWHATTWLFSHTCTLVWPCWEPSGPLQVREQGWGRSKWR